MPLILHKESDLRLAARQAFLEAMRVHAYPALVSLAEHVFPAWEKLSDLGLRYPEALNDSKFEPSQTRRFIERLMRRIKGAKDDEARLLYRGLEQLKKSVSRFRDEPAVPLPDGNVRITIRFVPHRSIVELSHPLDKVLSVIKAEQFNYGTLLSLGDSEIWDSADVLHECFLWSDLYDSVRAWLSLWRLAEPWLADCALQTVESWRRSRDGELGYFEYDRKRKPTRFVPNALKLRYDAWSSGKGPNETGHNNFAFDHWNPAAEDWKSYQKNKGQLFKLFLSDYRKRTLQSLGKKKPYIARRKQASYHYEWLVDFQINRLRISDIVNKHQRGGVRGLSRSTVSEAIYSLAGLIDLRLGTELEEASHS